MNVVSNDGYNEFHYLASKINREGAIEIARILLEKNTSLTNIDKKYGNSAMFTLCMEVFKARSEEGLRFIECCCDNFDDYDVCNKNGYSVRMLITERGTDRMKKTMGDSQ